MISHKAVPRLASLSSLQNWGALPPRVIDAEVMPHFELSPQEWVYLAQAFFLASPPQRDALDMRRLSWAIGVASRVVPWRSDCLIQSMAADRWLRSCGVIPKFKLGAASDQSGHILGGRQIRRTAPECGRCHQDLLSPGCSGRP